MIKAFPLCFQGSCWTASKPGKGTARVYQRNSEVRSDTRTAELPKGRATDTLSLGRPCAQPLAGSAGGKPRHAEGKRDARGHVVTRRQKGEYYLDLLSRSDAPGVLLRATVCVLRALGFQRGGGPAGAGDTWGVRLINPPRFKNEQWDERSGSIRRQTVPQQVCPHAEGAPGTSASPGTAARTCR